MVLNGEMESFVGTVPTFWTSTTPALISPENLQGRVHSGNFAVNLSNGAILTQLITRINAGCFYEFAFFARGEGAQVGLSATVNFVTPGGDVLGAIITVRQQDIPTDNREFEYYMRVTSAAPVGVTAARIDFSVAAAGQQSLDLDDVSFDVQ